MAKRPIEPSWLSRTVIDAIHHDQIREHGGLVGIRDENALESAIARPIQKWHYADRVDMATLAAAYAFGLVRDHPYRDGNKRIGFLAAVTFLGVNDYDFTATEPDVVTQVVALAAGGVSEEAFAEWIRRHMSTRA